MSAATTDKWGRALVPCEWCGDPTPMTGTKRCDRCYELETRIRNDLGRARRMLDAIMREASAK